MDESEPVDANEAYDLTELWLNEQEHIYWPIEITEDDFILKLVNKFDICYNIGEWTILHRII